MNVPVNLLSLSLVVLRYVTVVESPASLRYFETLSHVEVTTRTKKSIRGPRELIKHVNFRAFNRKFELTLTTGSSVLTRDFSASLVHADGSSTPFHIDQSKIFTGHLTGRPDVTAHANIIDTLWNIQILDENETYAVEPARRLLNERENPQNDTLIAYRGSDLVMSTTEGATFCHTKDPGAEAAFKSYKNGQEERNHTHEPHSRKKRAAHDTCILELVGDYDLYRRHCKENMLACSSLLIAYSHVANTIFRKSKFEGRNFQIITDVGVQVGNLILHTSYTTSTTNERYRHFNEEGILWDADSKLDSFSHYTSLSGRRFCLHHLLTSYPFPNRVLGLAWMKTTCLGMQSGSGMSSLSCGISSTLDGASGPITSMQGSLVFVHELGHNFGSEHDPQTDECSHLDNEGGDYLMWDRAVSGLLPNHWVFSPCTLRQIGRQLEQDRSCFIERSASLSLCGNGIVEPGEMCDAGSFGVTNTDPCCSSDCTLRPLAVCSPVNVACCTNCQMAPPSERCNAAEECRKESFCTGKSFNCPIPEQKQDWIECRDGGNCYGGECKGYCETMSIKLELQLKPCLCHANDTAACMWCCFNASDPANPGACLPHSDTILNDGRPCYKGYCKSGVCIQGPTVSTIKRVYKYMTTFHSSKLVMFIRSNIVLTVIVLSLMIWVPPSYIIYRADCRERAHREKHLYRQLMTELRTEERVAERHRQADVSVHSGSDHSRDNDSMLAFLETVSREGISAMRGPKHMDNDGGEDVESLDLHHHHRHQSTTSNKLRPERGSGRSLDLLGVQRKSTMDQTAMHTSQPASAERPIKPEAALHHADETQSWPFGRKNGRSMDSGSSTDAPGFGKH